MLEVASGLEREGELSRDGFPSDGFLGGVLEVCETEARDRREEDSARARALPIDLA